MPRWLEVLLAVVFLSLMVVVPAFMLARDHARGRQDPGYEGGDREQTRPR